MILDRRRNVEPSELGELLEQLPARVLLDRMPGPVIGMSEQGVVLYANPAAAALLGYHNGALVGRDLSSLLVGRSLDSGEDCVSALRGALAGDVVDWCHTEGYSVHIAMSTPLLLRVSDPFLMVSLTDVTELHWS